jgi:hypothetical protein
MSSSANWGNGGYLMVTTTTTTTPTSGNTHTQRDTHAHELRLGGYSVEERGKAALFEIVDCETYRTSEVVNEVCVKKTLEEIKALEEERRRRGGQGGGGGRGW